jgi:eukaryotic-like serine/threonine-protein kinase
VDAASGTVLWHRAFGDPARLDPAYVAVADGVVFTTVSGGLAALNGASGQTLWHVPVDGGVNVWPAVAGNVVYSGSEHGVLDAWQATTGNRLWSHPTSAPALPVASNIVLAGDMLYFGSEDRNVYALAI